MFYRAINREQRLRDEDPLIKNSQLNSETMINAIDESKADHAKLDEFWKVKTRGKGKDFSE